MTLNGARIVISASRRTDIPAFYMPWFMERIRLGYFEVVNPFTRRSRQVAANPETVHSIVFWSKDYGPFLEAGHGEVLRNMGYHLFFHFTLNGERSILEPRLPGLGRRLDQLANLCDRYSPETVLWRFDPITFYMDSSGEILDNLADFSTIAQAATANGITRCISSFMDPYAKVTRRARRIPAIRFITPSEAVQVETVRKMAALLHRDHIHLSLCCEKALLAILPKDIPVTGGQCIPSERLVALFGQGIPTRRDPGQRRIKGCGCGVSVDIGDYLAHPCFHDCLYCYANPMALRPSSKDPAGFVHANR